MLTGLFTLLHAPTSHCNSNYCRLFADSKHCRPFVQNGSFSFEWAPFTDVYIIIVFGMRSSNRVFACIKYSVSSGIKPMSAFILMRTA